MITWKTLLIIVFGVILIIIILLVIFELLQPFPLKFSGLLELLERAISSVFDISEWPW